MVDGLLLLSDSDERYPVNLGNPVEMSILQFANEIRARFNNSIGIDFKPLPSDDPKLRRPDIAKAARVLGWTPKVPLGEGLTITIDYFKKKAQRDGSLRQPESTRRNARPDQIRV
jgi:dTDP-glucose 4,6-dehydratase